MYTINTEKLQEFINKTTMGELVEEFLMKFSKKGITVITSMISVVVSKGHLSSDVFDLYDTTERTVGIKTKILFQSLSRYKGVVKLDVDDNSSVLHITGKGKDGRDRLIDIPLIDKEYIKTDDKATVNVDRLYDSADDGVELKTDIFREAIANKKVSADGDIPMAIEFTGKSLTLRINNSGTRVDDEVADIDYPEGKGLYGNYLDEIIKVCGENIVVAFQKEMREDGPLMIEDQNVFWIIAPRME